MAVKTKNSSKNIWTLVIAGGVIYYFFFYDSGSKNNTVAKRSNAIAAAASAMPDDEKSFLAIITSSKDNFENQPNDMLKARERRSRKTALCQISRGIRDWTGTVSTISANGDGKGVLGVNIADHVTLTTSNNAFSDSFTHTLIDPDSALFAAASVLKEGQDVRFSGTFLPGDTDCFKEESITISGSMTSPDFVVRFSAVAPQ